MLQIDLWKRVTIILTIVVGLLMAFPNGFYDRVERANDAQAAIEDGSLTVSGDAFSVAQLEEMSGAWPSWLPSSLVNLGLDLRGGAHLLAEVQVEQVYATRMDNYWPVIRDALVVERDTVGFVNRDPGPENELRIRIGEADAVDRALEIVRAQAVPIVTLTGVGQTDIVASREGDVIVVRLTEAEIVATDTRTMQQSLEIIRRRIDEAGTREPTIQRQGTDRVLIQVPGVGSAQEVKDLIGAPGQLSFHAVVRQTSDGNASPGVGNVVLPDVEFPGQFYVLEQTPVVTGEDLVDSQPAFDQNNRPAVNFRFNPSGAQDFGDFTAQNVGSPLRLCLMARCCRPL